MNCNNRSFAYLTYRITEVPQGQYSGKDKTIQT